MSELTKAEVLLAIQCGLFDDEFDEIVSAITRRRKAIAAARRASEVQIGDQFKITNITPKEFDGLKVEAYAWEGSSKIKVVLLEDSNPIRNRGSRVYRLGETLTIPLVCIGEKL